MSKIKETGNARIKCVRSRKLEDRAKVLVLGRNVGHSESTRVPESNSQV